MNLSTYQSLFAKSVRFAETPDALTKQVVGGGNLSAEAGINVYRQMYWNRLVNAFFALLPKTAIVLGARRFTQLVCKHLSMTPSTAIALEQLALPCARYFARTDAPEEVCDLAMLEAYSVEALLSPDTPQKPLLIEDVRTPASGRLVRWHPSLAMLSVTEGAYGLYQTTDATQQPTAEGSPPSDVQGSAEKIYLLVFRSGFASSTLRISLDEYRGFSELPPAINLSTLIEILAGPKSEPILAFERLSSLIRHQLLWKVEAENEP